MEFTNEPVTKVEPYSPIADSMRELARRQAEAGREYAPLSNDDPVEEWDRPW